MPQPIERYSPHKIILNQKRLARWAWAAIFFIALSWVLLIISAPIARVYGFPGFSDSIYWFYSHLCHQISDRSFHVHEYPFAVCARCFGFYSGFLLGLILYPFHRMLDNTNPPPRIWLFLAMVPIGIDWSLGFFEIWENSHLSRTITGGILGIACAVFIVPAVVEISYYFGDRLRGE